MPIGILYKAKGFGGRLIEASYNDYIKLVILWAHF